MAITPSHKNSNKSRKRLQAHIQETAIDNNRKYITLTHHNKSTQKLAQRFKKLKYNIANTTNSTLQTYLTNRTTHNTKQEKHTTGVYKLKCNDCPKFYIGQAEIFYNMIH